MVIGNTIKKRRKTLNVTQPKLADLAGISVNTLYKIERGQSNPTLKTLSKIADILGMEVCLKVKSLDKNPK
ncbi:MAG: helix-turn-helix transcriptional regulator [Crocinitomicaceae bacterium]